MKKLSIKDSKFLDTLLATGNLSEAAKAAGSKGKDVHSLSTRGGQILKRLEVTLDELMDLHGLTTSKLVKKLNEGLDATKVISCNIIAKDGEGMADAHSMTKDFIDIEDYPTRHKYIELAFKVRGLLRDKFEVDESQLDELISALKQGPVKNKVEE